MLVEKPFVPCPECYGGHDPALHPCRDCHCRLSCRYYKLSASRMETRKHIVSFDAAQELAECADCDHIPGAEPEPDRRRDRIGELGRFFRYLLELDSYSLGIIAEVVAPSTPDRRCTVRHLSRLHGCSRQAMHKKLMKLIGSRPELAGLFRDTLSKLTAARRTFLRRRADHAAKP